MHKLTVIIYLITSFLKKHPLKKFKNSVCAYSKDIPLTWDISPERVPLER